MSASKFSLGFYYFHPYVVRRLLHDTEYDSLFGVQYSKLVGAFWYSTLKQAASRLHVYGNKMLVVISVKYTNRKTDCMVFVSSEIALRLSPYSQKMHNI